MVVSSDLFDLIQSLSRTEKAYFKKRGKIFLSEGRNNYLRLFDAIEGQKRYDEQKLRQLFKGEKLTRQFSVAKNYLYNRILETMQQYRNSRLTEVHGLMNRSEFLFEKGLFPQAEKQLRMAEKIVRKNDLHSICITINEQLRFDQFIKRRQPAKAVAAIATARKEAFLLHNHMEYASLLARIQHVYNQYGKTQNKKHLREFRQILREPKLQKESRALTFDARRRFNDIHAVYNSIIGKEEKAFLFSEKVIALYDEHPEKKKNNAILYAGYINNTLLYCHFLHRYKESEIYLAKLNAVRPLMNGRYEKARFFEIYLNNSLNLYNTTGQFEIAVKLLGQFILELPGHEAQLADRDKLLMYGNIANSFFGLTDYKNCLLWINKVRNELPSGIRPDLESEMHLLNILVHSELGHTELIPHLAASYQRFLRGKEMMTLPEKHLLAFFRKPGASDSEEKRRIAMSVLKDRITSYVKANQHKRSYTPPFFDILSWLESKLRKKNFTEVLKEKAARLQR